MRKLIYILILFVMTGCEYLDIQLPDVTGHWFRVEEPEWHFKVEKNHIRFFGYGREDVYDVLKDNVFDYYIQQGNYNENLPKIIEGTSRVEGTSLFLNMFVDGNRETWEFKRRATE